MYGYRVLLPVFQLLCILEVDGVILNGLAVVPHESAGVPETVAGLGHKRRVVYLSSHCHRRPADHTQPVNISSLLGDVVGKQAVANSSSVYCLEYLTVTSSVNFMRVRKFLVWRDSKKVKNHKKIFLKKFVL